MFSYLGETKLILIEQFKSKQLAIRAEEKLYKKIANNHIFKENTYDLIIDFLN
jgi:predicted GIY-YIG superfamily endonuclease